MTTLVYPYLHHPGTRDGFELKLSLRSVHAHLPPDVEVLVVGNELPSWVRAGTLEFVEREHRADWTPGRNVNNALFTASAAVATEKMVLMNDDFIITGVPEGTTFPMIYLMEWEEFYRATQRVHHTEVAYKACGRITHRLLKHLPDAKSFEGHNPMEVETAAMHEILKSVLGRAEGENVFIRSLYGNLAKPPSVHGRDLRLNAFDPPLRTVEDFARHRGWLSTNEKYTLKGQMECLAGMLNEPSRWEME